MLFRRYLMPIRDPLMSSSCLELNYPVKVTPRDNLLYVLQFVAYYVKIIFYLDIYI